MKKNYQYLLVVTLCLMIVACRNNSNNQNLNNVATIGTESIQLSEIDKLAKQELFDELNRIYVIRKTTLQLLLKEKVLQIEAKKLNLSIREMLNRYYKVKINDNVLNNYVVRNQLQRGIPELKRTLRYFDVKSVYGHELLVEAVKKSLKQKLVDSLLKVYNVKINLEAPTPMKMEVTKNLMVHYRGNPSSKVTLIEVSDYECENCKTTFPIMDEIYNKYKNAVKFGFTHFSSYVSICAIASECAAKQNKFWEMHDLITKTKALPDTSDLYNMAGRINLDLTKYKKDFKDRALEEHINNNFQNLISMGLYGTPSYIINGKVIFNSGSKVEIEKLLIKELNK